MPPPPRSEQPRRWPIIVGSAIALTLGVAMTTLWLHNTADPAFHEQPSIPVTEPGATVTVSSVDGACMGPFLTWHRRGLLGRWQQTHADGRRDVVPWYDLGDRTYASTLACSTEPVALAVPADIDLGVVAACTLDEHCVRVIVTEPRQSVTQPAPSAD